jgi:Golgi nucleoside diphosphatase
MNGVHQPPIVFRNSEFYGFSEFWYTMEDVFRIGGLYGSKKFEEEAKVCFFLLIDKKI